MMNEQVIIVIPIYKEQLVDTEKASLIQCLTTMHKHNITFITYKELDVSQYLVIAASCSKAINFEYFDKIYFSGIGGYNKLCMTTPLYKRFQRYEYMLIYQLDAWVFSDQLLYWCKKGYDYIGAPFERLYDKKKDVWVGNGGLSLRKINRFIEILESDNHVFSYIELIKKTNWLSIKSVGGLILRCLGYYNKPKNLNYGWNEDIWWCVFLFGTRFQLNLPSVQEASLFSLDKNPERLFNLSKIMPMGCHAWQKYPAFDFWKDKIVY